MSSPQPCHPERRGRRGHTPNRVEGACAPLEPQDTFTDSDSKESLSSDRTRAPDPVEALVPLAAQMMADRLPLLDRRSLSLPQGDVT